VAHVLFLLGLLDLNILLSSHLRLYRNLLLFMPGGVGNIEIYSYTLLVVLCRGLLSQPSNLSFHLLNIVFVCLDKKANFLLMEAVLELNFIQKLVGLGRKDVWDLFLLFLLFIILNIFKVN